MWNAELNESQTGIMIARRNMNNLRYTDYTPPYGRKWRGTKDYFMKEKEESEKVGLKHNIQKTKIMVSSPITSWQVDGKQWKQWETLFLWAPKSLQIGTAAIKLKVAYSLKGKLRPTEIAF